MNTYIILSRFSPEAFDDPKHFLELAGQVSKKIKSDCPGVRWKDSYATLGRFDVVDIVEFPDDLGYQQQLQMSPALYRRMIKPYHRKLVDAIKANSKAKVFLHSDGSLYPVIKDLIEIGIDILNPVQTTAKDMQSDRLKREFGNNLSFWGAIDTQHALPHGTPADVEGEVALRISHLAKGGGYVVASCHNIQAEVPPENVMAMFKAVDKYGKYPLKATA